MQRQQPLRLQGVTHQSIITEQQSENTPTVPPQLSVQQLESLKMTFQTYSSTKTVKKPPRSKLNANGVREIMHSQPEIDVTISEKQLGQLFIEAGMPLHKQTLAHLTAQLTSNRKGKGISFDDLLRVIRAPSGIEEEGELEQLFRMYDRKNKGYFDYEDYRFVCEGITLELNQAQIRQAFDGMDQKRQNRISFQDFCHIMRTKH